MAERDSTNTPVAAEALIAAAASLALHCIAPGCPHPSFRRRRAPRRLYPSRRPSAASPPRVPAATPRAQCHHPGALEPRYDPERRPRPAPSNECRGSEATATRQAPQDACSQGKGVAGRRTRVTVGSWASSSCSGAGLSQGPGEGGARPEGVRACRPARSAQRPTGTDAPGTLERPSPPRPPSRQSSRAATKVLGPSGNIRFPPWLLAHQPLTLIKLLHVLYLFSLCVKWR